MQLQLRSLADNRDRAIIVTDSDMRKRCHQIIAVCLRSAQHVKHMQMVLDVWPFIRYSSATETMRNVVTTLQLIACLAKQQVFFLLGYAGVTKGFGNCKCALLIYHISVVITLICASRLHKPDKILPHIPMCMRRRRRRACGCTLHNLTSTNHAKCRCAALIQTHTNTHSHTYSCSGGHPEKRRKTHTHTVHKSKLICTYYKCTEICMHGRAGRIITQYYVW